MKITGEDLRNAGGCGFVYSQFLRKFGDSAEVNADSLRWAKRLGHEWWAMQRLIPAENLIKIIQALQAEIAPKYHISLPAAYSPEEIIPYVNSVDGLYTKRSLAHGIKIIYDRTRHRRVNHPFIPAKRFWEIVLNVLEDKGVEKREESVNSEDAANARRRTKVGPNLRRTDPVATE